MANPHTSKPSNGLSYLGSERRLTPRVSVDLDVGMGSEHNFYSGLADNLSVGGIFVATHALKPLGEVVMLRLFLSDQDPPLQLEAQVRWTRELRDQSDLPPGMGLSFTALTLTDQHAIATLLKQPSPVVIEEK